MLERCRLACACDQEPRWRSPQNCRESRTSRGAARRV